ncbi:MAG: sugar-binding transcriptional regulator [Chloroflexi bacterium]|nr:sugar-binding transcriptional regulator [Chloroflexota bacterium]
MPDNLGQEEYELLARLAHRYYVDGRTQEELSREFGLSRPKVQRLLERARWTGVVDIHVEAPPWLHLDLEAQLRGAFGLADAIVSPARADPQAQREEVARCAARYLERRLRDGYVVAVSHGRDTGEVPRFFRPARRLGCTFVSAMGGSPRVDAPTNPNEICRAFAERAGGRAVSLFAPAYVESAEMRDRLLAQDAVAEALRVAAAASMALVGIGGTDDDCTMVRSGCFSAEELARLRRWGAVGDVLGNYVDARGRVIASPESGRLIGLSIDDLRRIETVIAVVSEAEKPKAILGVLRAGVVDVLILDEGNARAVLGATGEDRGSGTTRGAGTARVTRRWEAPRAGTKEVVGSTTVR